MEAGGSDAHEAKVVADHLVRSNLAGHDSHGVGMLPLYVDMLARDCLRPNVPLRTLSDAGSILQFAGDRGYGQRIGQEASNLAIERARETGLVLLTIKQTSHLGRIGTYAEQFMGAGLVSILFANVSDHRPLVAPYGGTDARYGTNPLCIGIPATDSSQEVLLDMATSATALGKTRVAHNAGVKMDADCLLDARGTPTDNPAVMWEPPFGAIGPLGRHKGYGIALMCELLGGVLSGGGTIQPGNERKDGILNNLFGIVVDPARLVDVGWMGSEIDATLRYFRDSPPADGHSGVLVAGEPEKSRAAERRERGIPFHEDAWSKILASGEQVGLTVSAMEAVL